MDQWSRRIIGFGIHRGNVDGIALCCMFNQATSGTDPPCYLSSDNDPLFRFHRWQANLRILELEEIKAVPYTPISHPFGERLIGTIRRQFLDHTPFRNSLDLQRKLGQFKNYYNKYRTHSSLTGLPPGEYQRPGTKSLLDIQYFSWKSHCNGLFQTPVPA
jgi:putative transposase